MVYGLHSTKSSSTKSTTVIRSIFPFSFRCYVIALQIYKHNVVCYHYHNTNLPIPRQGWARWVRNGVTEYDVDEQKEKLFTVEIIGMVMWYVMMMTDKDKRGNGLFEILLRYPPLFPNLRQGTQKTDTDKSGAEQRQRQGRILVLSCT